MLSLGHGGHIVVIHVYYPGASSDRISSQPCPISSCSTWRLYQSTGVQNKDLCVQTPITLSSPETSAQA